MADFVKETEVFLDNPATSKEEVLDFLSQKAVDLGIAEDVDVIRQAFQLREDEGSTGLQGGFAIPHAKSSEIKEPAVLVVKTEKPIDWKTMDGKPVQVAIALLVPDDKAGDLHLRLLADLTVLLLKPNFCQTVLDAEDAAAIASAINAGLTD